MENTVDILGKHFALSNNRFLLNTQDLYERNYFIFDGDLEDVG